MTRPLDLESRTAPPPPPEPTSIKETGLAQVQIEALLLKVLLHRGNCSGNTVAEVLCLPRGIVADMLDQLRNELMVTIKTSAGSHDFLYQLTEAGFERAQRYASRSNYAAAAPVAFDDYIESVRMQSLQTTSVNLDRLKKSLADMTIRPTP